MHYIYCYTNKISNRKYVGQTNNIKRRKNEHKSNSQNKYSPEYNLLFHKKLRQYGEENFIFSVLEEIESNDIQFVNEREKFWIKEMQSYVEQNGYNLTLGGENQEHSRIYSLEEIQEIKNKIKKKISYEEISNEYGISISYLSGINHGNLHYDKNENYPLCKFFSSEEELNNLINLLENTNMPMTEIAKSINKSYSYVKKINSGELCRDINRTYPIRKLNTTQIKALEIQKKLQQGLSDEEIMQQMQISQSTIKRINLGKSHYDKSLNYPLRKPVSTI